MSNRVEKIRFWLIGSAGFLMIVIVAFVGTARYLRRHYLAGLPAKLGVNIVRETNGYTYCQTVEGRTAYCIHAAKAIEHTDGKIGLHDVSITLYGKKGDRGDRIYGDEFEYDKNAEVVRATGVVHIDLQSAEAARRGEKDAASTKVVHVTTSGLVYLQKLGIAATSEAVDFASGGIAGHAVGADYGSDSGILMLHSAVSMSGTTGGHPLAMRAATAQFDDQRQQAYLTHTTYQSDGRTATAEQATLYRREDGTLSRVMGQGGVTIDEDGAKVSSEQADVELTATSQPQTAVFTGAVKYADDEPLRQLKGQADEATIGFDHQAKPQPAQAVFTGAAHLTERTRATAAANEPWSTRDLVAARVEATLEPVTGGRSQLRDVAATGNARMTVVNNGSVASSADEGTTELAADTLNAHLVDASDGKHVPQLDSLVGRGHTLLRQMTVDGMEQTSASDTLDAKFRPHAAAGGVSEGKKAANALLSSVQQGHVVMMRRTPGKPTAKGAAPVVEHAVADRAMYDGNQDQMTLSGGVEVEDAGSALWANQVEFDHATGDSHASGAVKVSYMADDAASGPSRPGARAEESTHVLADRADLDHASDTTTFSGRPVRLWQGGSQVQAPVLEFFRTQKRLVARGEGAQAASVRTVLAGSGNGGPAAGGAQTGSAGCSSSLPGKGGGEAAGWNPAAADAVRITSGGLVYTAGAGAATMAEAQFTGGFRADTVDGTIRAGEGTAFLRPSPATGTAAETPVGLSMSGGLDHVIATGKVELDQPGLKATGERLVYTESDGSALLTGDEKNPPKAVNAQGTTTGNALRFRSSCASGGNGRVEGNRIEVVGVPGQRVQTDARISDDGKKEKGKQ